MCCSIVRAVIINKCADNTLNNTILLAESALPIKFLTPVVQNPRDPTVSCYTKTAAIYPSQQQAKQRLQRRTGACTAQLYQHTLWPMVTQRHTRRRSLIRLGLPPFSIKKKKTPAEKGGREVKRREVAGEGEKKDAISHLFLFFISARAQRHGRNDTVSSTSPVPRSALPNAGLELTIYARFFHGQRTSRNFLQKGISPEKP